MNLWYTKSLFTVLEYTLHIQAISSTGLVVSTPARREVIKCQMSQEEITIKWFEIFHLLRSLASFLARLSSIILGLLSLQASLGEIVNRALSKISNETFHEYDILFCLEDNNILLPTLFVQSNKTFVYNTRPLFIIVFRQTRYLNWEIILSFIAM